MKKILALVLTLCLLCGGVAVAENTNTTINQDSNNKTASTTVSYTIQANESYTVTIPSKVELKGASDPEPSELMGTMTISLDATSFNVANKKISVTLTGKGSALKLKGDDTKQISYAIAKNGSSISQNSVCLEWESFSASSTASTELTIVTHGFGYGKSLPAGDYTDTLTFTVSVTENSSNAGGIDDIAGDAENSGITNSGN